MKLVEVTKATHSPVTLTEVKDHLQVEHDDDDASLQMMLDAAGEWVDQYLNRNVVKATFSLSLDCFPSEIELKRGPVQEVVSITYTDTAGDVQTLAVDQYELDTYNGVIYPAYNVTWPSTLSHRNVVTVTYNVGYYDATESPVNTTGHIPQDIKIACLMVIGDLYENRERQQDIQLYKNEAVEMLLGPYRYIPI